MPKKSSKLLIRSTGTGRGLVEIIDVDARHQPAPMPGHRVPAWLIHYGYEPDKTVRGVARAVMS